jgi:DNA invertase Pin-like site-specific DNA recombinase
MSEAELHVLRARLNGGIRNKAARGELRRGLPVGFVWGDADGQVRFHPDEAVVTTIHNVFARFAETGSARRVWLWFRSERLTFPLQMHQGAEIRWVEASYTAIHHVLTNPCLCRRLRLWQNAPGDDAGCGGRAQEAHSVSTAL